MASSDEDVSGGSGLLRGSQTRSYGSLIHSSSSPGCQRKIEHIIEAGDTLPGLALKYGVTIEQIQRANRLYTNDSIFLKKLLYIPLSDSTTRTNGLNAAESAESLSDSGETQVAVAGSSREEKDLHCVLSGKVPYGATRSQDLSATDFLRNLDSKINVSKSAAVKKLQEGNRLVIEPDTGWSSAEIGSRRPRASKTVSPRTQQRSMLGPVPLTKTTLAATLKDHEDEIFKL